MDKVKFSKLRLPPSKRSTSHSQITQFFAQSQQSKVVPVGDEDTNEAQEAAYYQSLSLPDPPSSAQKDQPPEATTTRPFTQFEYASAKELKYRRNDASARSPPPNAIKEFFDQSIGENDFEQPKEVVKKTKKPTATTTAKRKKCRPSKKQPTIRNALLQQEKLFSNILAEQSFAENVDPNELQLALALSRSEVETCRVEGDPNMDIDGASSNSTESLQLKLEEFGYKVKRNFNDNLSLYTNNKKRGKWANKFTPLTMRNEEQQKQKIKSKIEQVLNKYTDVIDHDIGCNYAITSALLSSMQSQEPIYQRHRLDDTAPLIQFYVSKIVEPTTVKAGYLLKDFRSIPGRDLSPTKPKKRERDMSDKLVEELKNVSPKTRETENEPCINQPETNRNFNRANSPDLFDDSEIEEYQEGSLVPATKASTMESLVLSSSNSEQIATGGNLENCAIKSLENVISISSIEDETAGIAVETVSILSSSSNSNDVLIYEKFSSDEVKISNLSNIWDQDLNYTKRTFQNDETNENLIDLTQEFDEHESIQSHEDPVSRLAKSSSRNSIKSIERENLSQESSASVLNLSDDEVNYSIKVVRGMNISRESTDHSSSKDDSIAKNTSGKSQTKVDNNFHYDLDTASTSYFHDNRPPYPYLGKTNMKSTSAATGEIANEHNTSYDSPCNESRIKSRGFETNEYYCYDNDVPKTSYLHDNRAPNPNDHNTNNDLFNKSNSFDCEKLNFSLAHEIMSHSLLEDDEDEDSNSAYNTEQNEKLVRTDSEQPAYLDLTQTSPSPPTIDSFRPFVDLTEDRNNTSLNSSVKYSKHHSDSFLLPKNTTPKALKRFSSSRKFSEFISDDAEFSDTDEIDRLIYGSPHRQKKENSADLQGLDQLLTGNINSAKTNDSFEEFTIGNKTYLIRCENVKEKPDYERMDSPTLLKELDKYGLKPFNRKKAIIMLEFIYNQTHPYLVEDADSDDDDNVDENMDLIEEPETAEKSAAPQEDSFKKHNSFNLKDCLGACLLNDDGIRPDLPNENFIFQTNVRVKIATARLPLHLAWFNLIKSNEKLREAVLHYEPIDLQEIYIFFKSIGYRYDPKDIKRFFDGRGIIFQYDLISRQDQRTRRKLSHRNRHDRP